MTAVSRRFAPRFFGLCAVLGLMLLTGCKNMLPDQAGFEARNACPEAGMVYGGSDIKLSDTSRIVIDRARMDCRRKRSVKFVDLEITFSATGTPLAADTSFEYFVAVLGADDAVLQREAYDAVLPAAGDTPGRVTESLSIQLPKPDGVRIAIGLVPKK